MKELLFFIGVTSCAQLLGQYVLDHSEFYRITDTQFGVYSVFHSGASECYQQQGRVEIQSNDTLYLKIVFETRVIVPAVPCDRTDTIAQTIFSPDVQYVNVSTGVVTFDQDDPTHPDTVWSIYDSTFAAAAGIGENALKAPQLSVESGTLTAVAPYRINHMAVIDFCGRRIAVAEENTMDIALLSSGLYLLQVVSGGRMQTVSWYKE